MSARRPAMALGPQAQHAPTGQVARGVVTIQMLFDLLFIGVAVRILGTSLRLHQGQEGPRIP